VLVVVVVIMVAIFSSCDAREVLLMIDREEGGKVYAVSKPQ
jgi:hypothetical protein